MSNFPTLNSGAIQQYPAVRSFAYTNHVLTFLDGSEQRYRSSASALRRWVIQLALLDNAEIRSLEQFFLDQQGAFESFAFTDPWDAVSYPDCSIERDQFLAVFEQELRGKTELIVRENRT